MLLRAPTRGSVWPWRSRGRCRPRQSADSASPPGLRARPGRIGRHRRRLAANARATIKAHHPEMSDERRALAEGSAEGARAATGGAAPDCRARTRTSPASFRHRTLAHGVRRCPAARAVDAGGCRSSRPDGRHVRPARPRRSSQGAGRRDSGRRDSPQCDRVRRRHAGDAHAGARALRCPRRASDRTARSSFPADRCWEASRRRS